MRREPHIPLFLWIATALLVHVSGGEGVARVSEVLGERLEVQRFADAVRRHVQTSNRPMEVALIDDGKEEPTPDQAKPDQSEPDDEAKPSDEPSPTKVKPEKEPPKPKAEAKQDLKKPELEKPKEAEKPKAVAEQKPKLEKKPDEEKKPAEALPPVKASNRIAVQQHVEKNQEDNPNAEFIGDEANKVAEQTQARITATDQNDANPTAGTSAGGPQNEVGNSHVTDVANSEDSAGAIDHAPNEQAAGAKVAQSVERAASGAPQQKFREVAPDRHEGKAVGQSTGSKLAADDAKKQSERLEVAGSRATPESPDLRTAKSGSDLIGEAEEAHVARSAQRARPKHLPPLRGEPNALDFLGLGANGTTPGGINLNLSPGAAFAAVGRDQLGKERLADGERRRSQHRGSWKTVGMERWRASIENYNASVKPGNQTALNSARVPFATYLNQIHNRLHPIFADSFLGSLESLPSDNPLSNPDMKTNLEIVLDKDEGKIVKMGITRSSGSTLFDVAALESVQNAAPFGKPPPIIVSPDGKVYLHWEFYRNPFYACSTYFAHPFLLKAAPENAPTHVPPESTPSFGPREQPVPSGRTGDLGLLERPQPRPAL